MKKLLIVNAGSSSMKFRLYEKDGLVELADGIIDRISFGGSFTIKYDGKKHSFEKEFKDHSQAIIELKEQLISLGILKSFDDIEGVGHRVVQGGTIFPKSALLGPKEIDQIEELSSLAPLHNPGAVKVMREFVKFAPNAKNVAVFDTSYHTTMPAKNYTYAVPEKWITDYKVRRYGAHGTSHKYMARRLEEILGKDKLNIISCHLGNGASLCAIKDSKSYNTSMGLTPLAGIVMGTRSGDIDPSILEYVVNQSGKSIKEVTNSLNKESGMLALSGISNDMRDVDAAIEKGDEKAKLARQIYTKRVADYIVQYQNDLDNKVDAIVFTAGIGENDKIVRSEIIKAVKTMNISIKDELNKAKPEDDYLLLSDETSDVPIYMIQTDEELMIAKDLIKYAGL